MSFEGLVHFLGHDVKGHGVIQGHIVTELMNIDLLPFDMFSTCAQSDDRFGRCPYFITNLILTNDFVTK